MTLPAVMESTAAASSLLCPTDCSSFQSRHAAVRTAVFLLPHASCQPISAGC
jgi:hypothetical protein